MCQCWHCWGSSWMPTRHPGELTPAHCPRAEGPWQEVGSRVHWRGLWVVQDEHCSVTWA